MKNKLTLSKQYAIKQHKSQYRKNNKTPYWYHLRDVVDNLEIMGIKDESILCAGWLHDSIEDTSFDFDDVSKLFGEKIAQIVSDLTKETRLPKNQQEKIIYSNFLIPLGRQRLSNLLIFWQIFLTCKILN